jgi:predicted transcriptional regulator of viral defense system
LVKQNDFEGLWERLLSEGRGAISTGQIGQEAGASPESIRSATSYAIGKGWLFSPTRGLYVVVPPQYRSWGVVPAEHFIDDMMRHLGCRYYVAFLSAAAHWGSSHHAVQEYQVVVDRHVRDRAIHRVRLRFHQVGAFDNREFGRVAGTHAMVNIASPEQTAIDLVESPDWGGGLSNVATVIGELGELDGARLARLTDPLAVPVAQRLGWMLEHLNAQIDLQELELIARRRVRSARLDPRKPPGGQVDKRWGINVNATVEVEA